MFEVNQAVLVTVYSLLSCLAVDMSQMPRKTTKTEATPMLERDELIQASNLMVRAIVNDQGPKILDLIASQNDRAKQWLEVTLKMPIEIYSGYSVAAGGMSEAAKRQRDEIPQHDTDDESSPRSTLWSVVGSQPQGKMFNYVGNANSSTPMPAGMGPAGVAPLAISMVYAGMDLQEDRSISVPPDVTSLDDWSTTKLRMKKYESKGWNYAQLAQEAKTDAEARSYMQWIVKTYGKDTEKPCETQAADLARFLLRMRWMEIAKVKSGFQRER